MLGTLCEIRKPAFKKGDRKFMTLLPSFNGKEAYLTNRRGFIKRPLFIGVICMKRGD